jgi:type IV pilus biogenesis protein CpaD/CtpE
MQVFTVFLALLLAACATTPTALQQASNVASSRILAAQWVSQAPYTGSLVIKRDSGFMGSACTIRVFVDAVPVADLAPAEKVEIFVPMGEHIVGVTSNGICGGGVAETAVVIGLERQKILRIASGQSGDIYLQPSAF